MLTHTQQLSMYNISPLEFQRLLLDTGIMDCLCYLLNDEINFKNNEDFQCLPYYSLSCIQQLVCNKKVEHALFEEASDSYALQCFMKCKQNKYFFEVPFKKNMIEMIKFLLASRTMSNSQEFLKMLYSSNKDMMERIFKIYSESHILMENEYKRKYKKYELILYSLGVAGKKNF